MVKCEIRDSTSWIFQFIFSYLWLFYTLFPVQFLLGAENPCFPVDCQILELLINDGI
jgi:hypothetical protein